MRNEGVTIGIYWEVGPVKGTEEERLATFGRLVLGEVKELIVDERLDEQHDSYANLAVRCGLVRKVAFDPAQHDKLFNDHDIELGDVVYIWD